MVLTSYRLENAGPRDWPTLRDLLVGAGAAHHCPELAAAVAHAPRAADAWRQRMAGMCGPGRLALFARDDEGVRGFVSAYVDGDGEERHVIVRHLLVPTSDPAAVTTMHVLLERVENWAGIEMAGELLMEVTSDDADLNDLLGARGYRRTGVTRPGFEASIGGRSTSGTPSAAEWRRAVRVGRRSAFRTLFAVAS